MEVTVTITIDDIINYFEYGDCTISDDDLMALHSAVTNELANRSIEIDYDNTIGD